MTLPRLSALYAHWRRHPRVEWLVAGYLKYKPQPDAEGGGAPGRFEDLARLFGTTQGLKVVKSS